MLKPHNRAAFLTSEELGQAAAFPIANYSPSSIQSAFGSIRSQWPESPLRVALFNTSFGVWKVCAFHMFPSLRSSLTRNPQPFLEVTPEEVQESVDTNIVAAFAFSREAITAFKGLDLNDKGKRGTLLFTGATASLRGNTTTSAFAAGKFAVRALSQSLAKEFGKENIHVAHAIIDGGILTDRSASHTPKEKLEDPNALLSPESIGNVRPSLTTQRRNCSSLIACSRTCTLLIRIDPRGPGSLIVSHLFSKASVKGLLT